MTTGSADGWLDASVILRHLTGDPPELAEAAGQLFASAEADRLRLYVHSITIAEVVWVLEHHYRVDRHAMTRVLRLFLQSPAVRCEESASLLLALEHYGTANVDFADAVVASKAGSSPAPVCYTFDERHFRRLPVQVRRPGS